MTENIINIAEHCTLNDIEKLKSLLDKIEKKKKL